MLILLMIILLLANMKFSLVVANIYLVPVVTLQNHFWKIRIGINKYYFFFFVNLSVYFVSFHLE